MTRHMLGYLGGDSNTLVARTAKENDIKVAVEFVDHNKMLVISVMQEGEVMVSFTDVKDNTDEPTMIMQIVGKVHESERGELYYMPSDTIVKEERPTPVTFEDAQHLQLVDDEDDD